MSTANPPPMSTANLAPAIVLHNAGQISSDAHADAVAASGAKIAFLALPHGLAHEYAKPLLEHGLKVIDLSADFRVAAKKLGMNEIH